MNVPLIFSCTILMVAVHFCTFDVLQGRHAVESKYWWLQGGQNLGCFAGAIYFEHA